MKRGYWIRRWRFTGRGDIVQTLDQDNRWSLATNKAREFKSFGVAYQYARNLFVNGHVPASRVFIVGPRGGLHYLKAKDRNL